MMEAKTTVAVTKLKMQARSTALLRPTIDRFQADEEAPGGVNPPSFTTVLTHTPLAIEARKPPAASAARTVVVRLEEVRKILESPKGWCRNEVELATPAVRSRRKSYGCVDL
jgi:hypothetical protein